MQLCRCSWCKVQKEKCDMMMMMHAGIANASIVSNNVTRQYCDLEGEGGPGGDGWGCAC